MEKWCYTDRVRGQTTDENRSPLSRLSVLCENNGSKRSLIGKQSVVKVTFIFIHKCWSLNRFWLFHRSCSRLQATTKKTKSPKYWRQYHLLTEKRWDNPENTSLQSFHTHQEQSVQMPHHQVSKKLLSRQNFHPQILAGLPLRTTVKLWKIN